MENDVKHKHKSFRLRVLSHEFTKHPTEVAPMVLVAQRIGDYDLHGTVIFSSIRWIKELLDIRSIHILLILETNLDTPTSRGSAVETVRHASKPASTRQPAQVNRFLAKILVEAPLPRNKKHRGYDCVPIMRGKRAPVD
jgi:hypothetical protein